MKFFLTLILLGGLAAGGYYLWQKHNAKPADAGPELVPTVVTRGTIMQAVSSTGRVVSNLDVDIKCKASGQVVKIPFDVSDAVKKDQLLLEIDPIDEERAARQAEVAVAESQAKLEQAKQNLAIGEKTLVTTRARVEAMIPSAETRAKDAHSKLDRRKDLLEKNLGTQEDYDSALTASMAADADLRSSQIQLDELKTQEVALEVKRQDVKLAEGELENDQIQLSNARQRLVDTKVLAPIDGVVSARTVNIGQIISSGITNVGGGTAVLTLSDLSRMFVLGSVDESDIGRVKLDYPVTITVDAYPRMKFEGKVVRIATRGVNVSNVVTFEVKIEVTSENKSMLKPEMTANVQIIAAQKDDVLMVPTLAITRERDAGRDSVVATVKTPAGTLERRPVKTGMSDGQNFEVISGLSENETVMVKKGEPSKWRSDGGGRGGSPMMFGGGRGR